MAQALYDQSPLARDRFAQAAELLEFPIHEIMFGGTTDQLMQTSVTQPAIFLHSVILAEVMGAAKQAYMTAGHSLGEFSALVVAKALDFESGLRLVRARAEAMQKACDLEPSTMAAIVGLDDKAVERICGEVSGIVVPANYNAPGQLVISGQTHAVEAAVALAKERGAKIAKLLSVNGAFHSPLMEPARSELAEAIVQTAFHSPVCSVYQNVSARGETNPADIQLNLINQLTAPVRWTQSIQQMHQDGARRFVELGPGKVLSGVIKRIAPEAALENHDAPPAA
jgi:[acyl-carrier-protein] S-malonyltransferase